jgi:hypothetical protein
MALTQVNHIMMDILHSVSPTGTKVTTALSSRTQPLPVPFKVLVTLTLYKLPCHALAFLPSLELLVIISDNCVVGAIEQ